MPRPHIYLLVALLAAFGVSHFSHHIDPYHLDVLTGIGIISYSLYLWHTPILVWVGAEQTETSAASVIGVALALIAATASYYLVELPFLRHPEELRQGTVWGEFLESLHGARRA